MAEGGGIDEVVGGLGLRFFGLMTVVVGYEFSLSAESRKSSLGRFVPLSLAGEAIWVGLMWVDGLAEDDCCSGFACLATRCDIFILRMA